MTKKRTFDSVNGGRARDNVQRYKAAAIRLAELEGEIGERRDELKSEKKRIRAEIDEREAERRQLAEKVRSGQWGLFD